jgi:hypothetical protein
VSRATTIFLSALLLISGCIAFVLLPRGHQSLVITDVSHPFLASVTSPIRPLGSGALFVFIEGQLDGDAVLEVTSNRGRDRREFPLRGPQVSFITGGAEDWVDDLQIQYRPTTAKAGQLYVALYCGAGFTPDDLKRYSRLSRNRQ